MASVAEEVNAKISAHGIWEAAEMASPRGVFAFITCLRLHDIGNWSYRSHYQRAL
jgi:hypothetical protein